MESNVAHNAKLFNNGCSQEARLPEAYRFDGAEVFIRRDPLGGDVILSQRPENWDGFFDALKGAKVTTEFLNQTERCQKPEDRDPFEGYSE
jgi:antitoxin VapB